VEKKWGHNLRGKVVSADTGRAISHIFEDSFDGRGRFGRWE